MKGSGNEFALFRDYVGIQVSARCWLIIIDFSENYCRGVAAVDGVSLLEIMAQSKGFFDDIKKEIECSLCEEQFSEIKEPKILNCFHTFCKPCLKNWLQKNREGVISCPNRCHKITKCPDNNVDRLQPNFHLKHIVDIVEAYSGQGQEDLAHCGNCDEGKPLKYYCSNCNFFLCEDCAGLHKNWKDFRGHHVKEIRNFDSSDVQDYARRAANGCTQHNQELRFYCEQCVVCLCQDCAILEHRGVDHNIISIDQGVDKKKYEIEAKIREAQANGLRLKIHREDMEKRKQKVTNSIDEATNEVHRVTEQCILLIRQHEASVTEKLTKDKSAIQDAFAIQLSGLDGKQAEIESSVTFSKETLDRRNLPEILNVQKMIEQRLEELSTPFEFMPTLDYSEVKYIPNDVSFQRNAPGKLETSKTEASLSLAEGKGLTEGLQGEDCAFTVVTKDSGGGATYSEIDKIDVEIKSASQGNHDIKPVVLDSKNGRYTISYRPSTAGEYTVSIKVAGNSIKGSPFKLTVKTGSKSKSKTGF